MKKSEVKPIMCGSDYLRGLNWQPIKRTRQGAERIAAEQARKAMPPGFWHGVVSDCGSYYRINIAGQEESHERIQA